jgi:putative ABC transport system permease protein
MISEAMARQYWPGQDPLGHRVRLGPAEDPKSPWRTIVGVAGDIHQSSFDREPNPTVYIPFTQLPLPAMSVALRTAGDPMSLVSATRTQVQGLDRDQPIYDVRTLDQLISDNISGVTFSVQMMTVFGLIALVLAAAGIFAVMAYSVAQRTHEIGVRMALGARRIDVLRLVVGNAVLLAIVGLAIGLPISFAMARLLASTLFGVVRMDVVVFVIFTAVLALTAALAGYLPARWATRVDPTVALRYE